MRMWLHLAIFIAFPAAFCAALTLPTEALDVAGYPLLAIAYLAVFATATGIIARRLSAYASALTAEASATPESDKEASR